MEFHKGPLLFRRSFWCSAATEIVEMSIRIRQVQQEPEVIGPVFRRIRGNCRLSAVEQLGFCEATPFEEQWGQRLQPPRTHLSTCVLHVKVNEDVGVYPIYLGHNAF